MTVGLTPTAVRELLDRQSALLRLTVHELRRPVAIAQGHLSMIADGTFGLIPRDADPHVRATAAAVQEMARLLDGLAAVARLDDAAEGLHRQPSSIGELTADCLAALSADASRRDVTLEQQGVDVDANVDRGHVRIAVLNLLSNAIEHSPTGATVRLSVSADQQMVTITVADHGPGVVATEATRLFEPWYRGRTGADTEGLGLGLWIVRRIAEWHGGAVTLDSGPAGSTFSIVLPRT